MLSEEDMKKCGDLAKNGKVEGRIHVLNPAIEVGLKRFRGFKCIDGDSLLAGKPEEEWLGKGNETYVNNKKRLRKWKSQIKKKELHQETGDKMKNE